MIQYLFSNKHYRLKLFLALFSIILLCIYGYINGPKQNIYFVDCLNNREECNGKEVLAVVGKVTSVEKKGFKMLHGGKEILVVGMPDGIRKGLYIDVLGTFHREGYLEMNTYHIHMERTIKLYVSLIPVFIVSFLLLKNFLLNRKTLHR